MWSERLREAGLEKLSQFRSRLELRNGAQANPEVVDLLRVLETDIHAILNETAEGTTPGVTDRLNKLALQFEVEHPQVAPVLRQVGEALSRVGL